MLWKYKRSNYITNILERNFACVDYVMDNLIVYDTVQFRIDGIEQWCWAKIFDVKVAQFRHIDLKKSELFLTIHIWKLYTETRWFTFVVS